MLELDGNYLEGGGQIVRTALALSTIMQKPFSVEKIRQGRPKPGLKAQHMHGIKALQKLCDAKVDGGELGSENLMYVPGKFKGGRVEIDIGTAGSITLLLQSVLLPCMFAEKNTRLKIIGGTDVIWSPSFDYFNNIILPQFKRYADIDVKLIKRGYYPKGGGVVEISVKPRMTAETLSGAGIDMIEQGNLMLIKGISHAAKEFEKAEVSERQAKSAEMLKKHDVPVQIQTEYCDTLCAGSGITLWGVFSKDEDEGTPILLGADSLGEKGKKAEIVGEECMKKLIEEIDSGAPVDNHLGDNLIPLLGLFGGRIRISEITKHTLTNIYVCEQFLEKKYAVDENTVQV